jgi:hypothetical protein
MMILPVPRKRPPIVDDIENSEFVCAPPGKRATKEHRVVDKTVKDGAALSSALKKDPVKIIQRPA